MSNSDGNWKRNKRRRLDYPADVPHEVVETDGAHHFRVPDSSPSYVSSLASVANPLSYTSPETSTTLSSGGVLYGTVSNETLISETGLCGTVSSETLISETGLCGTVSSETPISETKLCGTVSSETLISETGLCGTVSSETPISETGLCGTVSPETLISETGLCGTVSSETLISETGLCGTVSSETLISETGSYRLESSGRVLSAMIISSEVDYLGEKCKKEEPCLVDRDVCYVPVDANLLRAANSDSFNEAVVLLTSENAFTPAGLNQALISACRRGYKLLVQKLFQAGANIEYRDEHGNTPLLICAEHGFTDIVRFLVSRHANVNAVNSVGNTALILSVRPAGSTDLTSFLLEQQDVDIHHENQHGQTALIRAAYFMDVDTMRSWLQNSMKRSGVRGYGKALKKSFFDNKSQKIKHKAAIAEAGLTDVFKILTEHLTNRQSPLGLAIKAGDTQSLDIFLDCQFSSKEEKKILVNMALVSVIERCRQTNVQSSSSNNVQIIRKLLQNGAEVHQRDGPKLISLAVESGNIELVELLCTKDAHRTMYDSKEQYPLVIAAKNGRQDLIELLLKYKACVNLVGFSKSALDCALMNDHIECAKLLIEHGAKMDIKCALSSAVDCQEPHYMHFLFENYKQEIVDYFSQEPLEASELLTSAAQKGNCEIIGQILDAGIDVNEADSTGRIPLMMSNNKAVVEFLILRGADVNREIKVWTGMKTTLSHVIMCTDFVDSSKFELCKVLIDSGAAVNYRNGHGETPLMMAASRDGCVDILQMLLNKNVDINGKDNEGNTALHHTVMRQQSDNVTCLIDSAKDKTNFINVQNNEGLTPLILSVQKGNIAIVRELVEKGADVNMKDNEENSALHHLLITCPWSMEEILTSLLDAGSHVNCQNNDGLSPLMLAAKKSKPSVVLSLLDAGADVNAVSKKNTSQTALSFLPGFKTYITNRAISCIETLLERGAKCSYLEKECFHKLIISDKISVIPKLIQYGVEPAEVEASKIGLRIRKPLVLPTVSPLCAALLFGQVQLARYFVDILFVTRSDLSMIAFNKTMKHLLHKGPDDSLEFLHELSSQPMSLVKLCLVTVSAAVGLSPGREARVNSLGLPQRMKDILMFKSALGDNQELDTMPNTADDAVSGQHLHMLRFFKSFDNSYMDDSDSSDYNDALYSVDLE